ncbi:MAG: hypothetical protein WCO02_07240 [Bacteroidota bacterium]
MKNFTLSVLILVLFAGTAFAQTQQAVAKEKKHQIDLMNEVYATYGIGSLFYFINQSSSNSYTSPGSFIIGYTRTLNKVVGVGFQIAYTPVTIQYETGSSTSKEINNYFQGLARVKFQYLNKPIFAMYSGVAIGVTMDYYSQTSKSGTTSNSQKLYPAGQLTLIGFRVGRTGAFVGEFGIGTLSILNLGVSIKFGE